MVTDPYLQKAVKTKRIIGHIKGDHPGPTLVFFGGIHGNEQSGVIALEHVFQELNDSPLSCKGSAYGIRGNIPALMKGKRFLEKDLNRIWTHSKIKNINGKTNAEHSVEDKELVAIHKVISGILENEKGPFYFIDFHTTSSKTLPFVTINDALINRRFAKLFPVPIILGIEEYLEGPLLSYINEKGYVALGFESGQHSEEMSIKNSIAFTWLTMAFSGFLNKTDVGKFKDYYGQLQKSADYNSNFYEIEYRHHLNDIRDFKMMDGFRSFETVVEGTPLALEKENLIKAEKDTIIFMPLYQEQGEEGFFLIRKTPSWALILSGFLRRTNFGALLHILPGVSWANKQKQSLLVNTKVAHFFTKPFFHLLGYRNRVLDKTHFAMNNRELTAKNEMYRNTWWYRITTNKSI
ncbi:MAG: succinylglutamate desuccinylase/aspartoacylase family protein [Maribacter sp.]|nr:succinylglutamate desuccinylase/aspartoacylase family protein [Maribacter sp.]MBT8314410.1 succinylglutamate desuccinylase/aspartoacylase family protein [Maribacter sp.]